MTVSIRCPACRGAKTVVKLGGMTGDCNLCTGKGTVYEADKPAVKEVIIEEVISKELVDKVANVRNQAIPYKVGTQVLKEEILPEEPAIKLDPKKAVFKRKAVSK